MKLKNVLLIIWGEIRQFFTGIAVGAGSGYATYRLVQANQPATLSSINFPQSAIETATGFYTDNTMAVFIVVGIIVGYLIWRFRYKLPESVRRYMP